MELYTVERLTPVCKLSTMSKTFGGCDDGPSDFVVQSSPYSRDGYFCKTHADMTCRQLNLDSLTSAQSRPFGIDVQAPRR